MKRRTLLITAPALWLGLPVALSACDESDSGADDLSDVLYEGGATDEGLVDLLARTPIDGSAEAANILEPSAGAALPSAPATFSWAVGATARVPHGFEPRRSAPRPRTRLGLRTLLGPGVAYAHGAPINGRAYFLVLSTPGKAKLVRVFTMNLSFTPSASVWERVLGSGEPVTASVLSAIFENNRVAQDGGPFVGPAVTYAAP